LIDQQVALAKQTAAAAQLAYVQGRNASADVIAARAMAIKMQDEHDQAGQAMRTARLALARWSGDDARRPLSIRPPLDELPLHAHQDVAKLEEQLRQHPDIVLLDKQREAARIEAELARAERQSDWSVELMYGKRGSAFDDMISLGVSIPLQLNRGKRQDREVAARLGMASAAKAKRDDLYREHVAEVRTMLDQWRTTHVRLQRYENELLPLANDQVVLAEAAYRGGKSSLEALIMARRNVVDTSLQALQIESEIAMLWAELSFMASTDDNVATRAGVTP
jgi:outer membrane protein TolC